MRLFAKKSTDTEGSWIENFFRITAQKLTKRPQPSTTDIAASQWWYEVGILPQIHPERIFKDQNAVNASLEKCRRESEEIDKKYSGRLKELTPTQFNQFLVAQQNVAATSKCLSTFFGVLESIDIGNIDYATEQKRALDQSLIACNRPHDEMLDLGAEYLKHMRRAHETSDFHPFLDRIIKLRPQKKLTLEEHNRVVQRSALLDYREGTLREVRTIELQKPGQNVTAAANTLFAKQADAYVAVFSERLNANHALATQCGHDTPQQLFHDTHNVKSEEITALRQTVHANLGMIHTYMLWKAAHFGVTHLDSESLHISPYTNSTARNPISWIDAQRRTIANYAEFSPEFGALAAATFLDGRVHALSSARRGDSNVNYEGTPETGPQVFVTYQGFSSDEQMLHHEIGHAIHSGLAQERGIFLSSPSKMIAETCAMFGEKLFTHAEARRHPESTQALVQRLNGFDSRVMIVCTQMMLHDFHNKASSLAAQGGLTKDTLGKEWLNVNRTYFGDAVKFTEQDKNGWIGYMPSLRTPLHSTAYVYGQLVTDALWDDYKKRGKDFVRDYTDFLKAGGIKPPHEALKSFGFDTCSTDFWNKQLRTMGRELATLTRHTHQIKQTQRPCGQPPTSPQFFNHS